MVSHMLIYAFMHICSECKISFGCAELRSHMVTQSKGKAYNCVQCHKSFGQAGHLKMHIATHSNEKTYTCVQGGITCGTIDEPRKSSKAIDERVIIDFRDKNVIIARFSYKNGGFLFYR